MKPEKFSIGEKVFLIHLQQEGIVKRWSGTELLYVEVAGDEIPVFTNDVSKKNPLKEEQDQLTRKADEKRRTEKKEIKRTNSGIFISFSPVKFSGEEISSFDIYLINDTSESIDFDYYFLLGEEIHFALKKPLKPFDYMLLHSIEYDLLNELPSVQLAVRDVMNKSFSGNMNQKIKPQNFFNKLQPSPLMNEESYCYKVNLGRAKKTEEPKPKEKVSFDPETLKHLMQESITSKDSDVSSPVEEIDLHIEALAKDHSTMSNAEMIHMQLAKFQQALERAIAHGADKFYVIHGVGTGKLRNEIHHLLKQYREVKSFNNDYHPRYGFGATEVILQ